MPGVYKTNKIKELGNICKLGTVKDRQFPEERLDSLVRRHFCPESIKSIDNSFVISHDKDGNKIVRGHRLYQKMNKYCIAFETAMKNKFKHKLVNIFNHGFLKVKDVDGNVIGKYDVEILNNGGSDFLNLDSKETKELNKEIDKFKGEFEKYFNDIS